MTKKESASRIIINKLLERSGWTLEDNPNPSVITEVLTSERKSSDYVLLDSKNNHLCVLEAKNAKINPLSAKKQSKDYAKSLNCRYVILSNGITHYLWDLNQGNPQKILTFPTQDKLEGKTNTKISSLVNIDEYYIANSTYPNFLEHTDYQDIETREDFLESNDIRILRYYQVDAINAVKKSIVENKDRFLLEMATGTGKTLVSAGLIKMFLSNIGVNRVLFLVDRIELENQAYTSFHKLLSKDFISLIWKENRDDWRKGQVLISTIQSFIQDTKYKEIFSHDEFGLIIVDESHRSLGVSGRDCMEYFDGYKVGLTATPRDYFKGMDKEKMQSNNYFDYEQRMLRDTYEIFGCFEREPTYKYTLEDGVKDGYLIQPKVIKANTDITTKLLTKSGLRIEEYDDNGNMRVKNAKRKDFERTVFNEETNVEFCKIFLDNAKRDPITNEIGKTIIFCVSQNHAAHITQILNQFSDNLFPEKYSSDFAEQITSQITDRQEMTISFNHKKNKLNGYSKFNSNYRTSKTRIAVTVDMMTTGYDCQDLLNICFMRPVLSPSNFIQMKGRGTRTFNYRNLIIEDNNRYSHIELNKAEFFLFDYFGNYDYFEKEFDYFKIIDVPNASSGTDGPVNKKYKVDLKSPDKQKEVIKIILGDEGMKIDRDLYPSIKKKIIANRKLEQYVYESNYDEAEKLLFSQNTNIDLKKISLSIGLDRNITTKELLLYSFGIMDSIPLKQDLINIEFLHFCNEKKISPLDHKKIKLLFDAYYSDKSFRSLVDEKKFGRLDTHALGNCINDSNYEYLKIIPEYFKGMDDPKRITNEPIN